LIMEFEAALMSEIVFIVEQAPEGGYIAVLWASPFSPKPILKLL